MKLCIVYNFAKIYRQPIFQLFYLTWCCDWYFGRNTTDIKGIEDGVLQNATYVDNRHLIGPMEWQMGIGKLIRQKGSDIFLMLGEPMCMSTWWTLLQRKLFFRKKRVYLWTHGWYGRETFSKKWLKRAFFGMADHIFTYGEYARQEAIKQGFDGDKITPIHNSLNHSLQVELRNRLAPSDLYLDHFGNDNPTLIFIGRLTNSKRLDLLINAVAKLKSNGYNYNIVMIGNGEARENLENLVSKLILNNQVWFYGACYDDYKNAALIYNADICVSPGNVGLTAMHTMVFGTPVITHNDFRYQGPEFEAIIPGETGSFFKRGDVESLANEISNWFTSHPDREAVRQACYNEIDSRWTPEYQLEILKQHLFH